MKRILNWLQAKSSKQAAAPEAETFRMPVGVKATAEQSVKDEYTVEVGFDPEVSGRIENNGPGKNVLTSGKYSGAEVTTVPDLQILDETQPGASYESGFNPYDTARFDTSKSWGTKSRK